MIFKTYLFKNNLLNWLAISFILIILIWLSKAVAFLNLVTENGIDLKDFFLLFVFILPWILIYIFPISFCIALLLTINRFNSFSEIVVLKNFGISNFKLSLPFIYLGFLISVFNFLLSFYIMPMANKQFRISKQNIKENYANLSFASQNFENFNKSTIYVQQKNENNILRGLLINDQRSEDYAITLSAQSANIILRDNEIFLRLNNGSLQRYNYLTMKSEILKFDNYIFNLNEKNQELFKYKWKPNERFISELIFYEDSLSPKEIKELKSELHKRINDPLISLVFSVIISAVLLKSKINRKKNNHSNLLALILCVAYILLLIFSYRLNDKREDLFFLPYFINLVFYSTSIIFLLINSRKSSL